MFAVVFPLAPFFAILNNVWEFKLDLNMLVKTRRPHVRDSMLLVEISRYYCFEVLQ